MSKNALNAPRPLFVDDVEGRWAAGGFVLPTGTVTFLMTDIEGSTRAWERSPEALAVAVPRHYEILDEAITAHGGVRPVEQGEGDSVVAAFSRASDAVRGGGRRRSGRWPPSAGPTAPSLAVRMALHTGEAQLRDEGNYFGLAIIRCARICGRAATAARCCCRMSPPAWSPTSSRRRDAGRSRPPSAQGPRSSGTGVAAGCTPICRPSSRRCCRWTRSVRTCRCSCRR